MNNGPFSIAQNNIKTTECEVTEPNIGIIKINLTDLEFQGILYAIEHKKYYIAEKAIKQFTDPNYALKIFEAIKMVPLCILAFLNNPHLREQLTFIELRNLIIRVQKQLSILQKSKKSIISLEEITVTIVKNPQLCRILGYRFYLDFVKNDALLANFIINSADYIVNLDYTHIDRKLINALPKCAPQILSTIQTVLQSKGNHYEWALNTIKWLFINNAIAKNLILNDFIFLDIHFELQEAFYKDRLFAVEVLKDPQLSSFIGVPSSTVYAHPLFKTEDYFYLSQHFENRHPSLAEQYLNLEFLSANNTLIYSLDTKSDKHIDSKNNLLDQLSGRMKKLTVGDTPSLYEQSHNPLLFESDNLQFNNSTQELSDSNSLQSARYKHKFY